MKKTNKKQEQEEGQNIMIRPTIIKKMRVPIKAQQGSTLLMHRVAPDVVKDMIAREFGKAKSKKFRDMEKEYKDCFHITSDGKYGYPVSGFFGGLLEAAVACTIPKTVIKRAVKIYGDIIPLKYKKLTQRTDVTRRSGITKAPDLRSRPEFHGWECVLDVAYDESQITPEQVVNLINKAGFVSGIGDWRPSSPNGGNHGMYEVAL